MARRIRRNECDCAGTAPGFPQHEPGCASQLEDSYDDEGGYDRLEEHPAYDPADDPWSQAEDREIPF